MGEGAAIVTQAAEGESSIYATDTEVVLKQARRLTKMHTDFDSYMHIGFEKKKICLEDIVSEREKHKKGMIENPFFNLFNLHWSSIQPILLP